ncbi:ABC transporter ATP-binding protein [Acuticoccus sediminis]|uniref:ABC transporter ATP-binding protein n=1 Tax=Acuticoccus sediminis TaxID=2184697 RepID=UPI00192E5B18|nr:ATP-binding cassette domain-containing protein [Acuticoccus sediminis]
MDGYSVDIRTKAHRDADGRAVAVLDGLAFTMPHGTFTALIGPSGCGKTTTLRILTGLDTDFAGTVDPALGEARIAVAFQEPRLLPWRTVADNVALALPDEADKAARVAAALEDVGLGGLGERFPAELSLGQARRAALARAFAVKPDVLYLDEPFVSLDETSAQNLRALLLSLWARNPMTILMVTHNVREAIQLADQIVLLSERPAHVVDVVSVPLARNSRDSEAISGFAATLSRKYPTIVAL